MLSSYRSNRTRHQISKSENFEEEPQQYYTFDTEDNSAARSGLHVIDADHGVFDSVNTRKRHHLFSPKNVINRFKSNTEQKVQLYSDTEDLSLRAEPELIDISQSMTPRSRYRNTRAPRMPSIPDSSLQYSLSSDDESDRDSISLQKDHLVTHASISKSNLQCDVSQKSILNPFKSNKKMSGRQLEKFTQQTSTPQATDMITMHKTKVELEYEKMKIKAEKYRAERDAMYAKAKLKALSNNLREYEYFCVNGIERDTRGRQIEDDGYDSDSQYGGYKKQQQPLLYPSPLQKSKLKKSNASSRSSNKRLKQSQNQQYDPPNMLPNLLSRLSSNMPPELAQAFNYYSEYLPSNGTAREFHNVMLSWVYTLPFLSLLYPILYTLRLAIPKDDDGWSLRALGVMIIDLFALLLYGWVSYGVLSWLIMFVTTFMKLARLFRII